MNVGNHLIERLQQNAIQTPTHVALSIYDGGTEHLTEITAQQLVLLAQKGRSALQQQGLKPGQRIIIALPTGEALLTALMGALWAGLVPSIMPVLARTFDQESLKRIQTLDASLLVTDQPFSDFPVPIVRSQDLLNTEPDCSPAYLDADLAYIQFSSGSTGDPKGIALNWSAIHHNLMAMEEWLWVPEPQRMLSWLPIFHDMGLFGGLLLPLYAGTEGVLMETAHFTRNPLRWFKLLSKYSIMTTATPPSALLTAIQLLQRKPLDDIDLSCVHHWVVGAERVSPHLVEVFQQVLVNQYHAHPHALRPVYGLAEATLAVTMSLTNQPSQIDWVDQQVLMTQQLAQTKPAGSPGTQGHVSVGFAISGVQVRIVDQQGTSLPERQVGSVWVASPSLLSGLIDESGLQPFTDTWLNTGDLGYLADGQLYLVGRSKDILIKKGRNYAPEHIEEIAHKQDFVRRAFAIGIYNEALSTERIILLLESSITQTAERDQLRLKLRSQLAQAGFEIDEMHFVARQSLPLTTSGKPRRQYARQLFLQDLLSPLPVAPQKTDVSTAVI